MFSKYLIVPICAWWAAAAIALAQPAGSMVTVRSYSGQFTAQEQLQRPRWARSLATTRVPLAGTWAFMLNSQAPVLTEGVDKISLQPALLVVSCERLKESVLGELGMVDQWQGRINLIIDAALPEEKGPLLTAIYHPQGWSYELELPKRIKPEILLRAVIQTLLVETANRNAGRQSAEIPFWLVEGMSAHVQAYHLPTLIIQPSLQSVRNTVRIDGLDVVRARLRRDTPLSFQQLSWPEDAPWTDRQRDLYRSCAQLFFERLLDFKDGKACFRTMLGQIPQHLNWQLAFLAGFQSHFSQLLDVEKWWGLTCVTFTGQDLTAPWTAQQCWRKLQDALDIPVEVRLDAGRMPAEARLTLQEVITQWEAKEADSTLQRVLDDLDELHARTGPELSNLVDVYRKTVESYLKGSEGIREGSLVWKHRLALQKSAAVRELDLLDFQREALRGRFARPHGASELSSAAKP